MTTANLFGVHIDICYPTLFFVKVCAVALILVVLRGIVWLIHMLAIRPFLDPLQSIPGPNGTFFQSHLRQVLDPNLSYRTNEDWSKRFGLNFRIHGFGQYDYRLMTFDIRSMSHVLTSAIYEKPWQTKDIISRLVGRGIFAVENAEHRMQRKIMAPAFTYHSVKTMAPVFFMKAEELCIRWKDVIGRDLKIEDVKVEDRTSPQIQPLSGPRIDIAQWITRASFDVMGLAGFNYNFHALQVESEEVYVALRQMFKVADKGMTLWNILELYFPILRKIFVSEDIRVTNQSLGVISRAGRKIVSQKIAEYLETQGQGMENKDLLTLLIKSNLSSEPSKRLTDQELLNQCTTILLAGSDTVAMGLSWSIYLISQHPEVQKALRQEILKASCSVDGYHSDTSGDSGFEDCTTCNLHEFAMTGRSCSCWKKRLEIIEGLPYLDSVVRESLRFCPPVHSTIRVATRDDYIPISHPVTLKNGKTVGMDLNGFIKIKKGSYVHIPIEGLNYSQDIWGSDALEFKPDRWKDIQDRDASKPGIGNLMTFGYGPQSCLGYKWTIMEMKIFLFTLLSTFEFSPAEGVPITKCNNFLTRPFVKGEWSAGSQLPMMVRELKRPVI